MTLMIDIKSLQEFDSTLKKSSIVVVHFWAEWSAHCKHMDAVMEELAKSYSQVTFVRVEAEEAVEISERYEVSAVPLFLIVKSGQLVERIDGADPAGLSQKVQAVAGEPKNGQKADNGNIVDRIKKLLASAPILLFMKGTPDAPKCKFSSKVTGILKKTGVTFQHFDILEDEEVRQGLKEYSKWPTFPQLYANGELVGGCDIIVELSETGDLANELGIAAVPETATDLNAKLTQLVNSQPVMLFMKGEPSAPKCGFSARVVEMLRTASVEFGHFDILEDETIRQGLKEYSQWPTFPQLYVKGELLGGCDIITELHEGGELKSSIQDAMEE